MGPESTHPVEAQRRMSLLKVSGAMMKCQHCASHNVRWFTPRSYADRAAVLLCMACRRLTIVPHRDRRAATWGDTERAA